MPQTWKYTIAHRVKGAWVRLENQEFTDPAAADAWIKSQPRKEWGNYEVRHLADGTAPPPDVGTVMTLRF